MFKLLIAALLLVSAHAQASPQRSQEEEKKEEQDTINSMMGVHGQTTIGYCPYRNILTGLCCSYNGGACVPVGGRRLSESEDELVVGYGYQDLNEAMQVSHDALNAVLPMSLEQAGKGNGDSLSLCPDGKATLITIPGRKTFLRRLAENESSSNSAIGSKYINKWAELGVSIQWAL